MKSYIARVLIEHVITPPPESYSSFSEVIVFGFYRLPQELEFSQILFDNRSDVLVELLHAISEKLNFEYVNADGATVVLRVREIVKIEDFNLDLNLKPDIYELDERLYTFREKMTFENFKEIYLVGNYL